MSSIAAFVQSISQSGYIESYLQKKKLVGTDDKLRQELIRQAVEVSSVELGIRACL